MQPDALHLPKIRLWLLACIAMVVLMVFVGGITRLSESGLSIVEWKPISGILPPLTDHAWEAEFNAYKRTPEFIQKNFTFGVEQFKTIFWLEYIHRLLGRITGLVFLLPLLYFAAKRQLPAPLMLRMTGMGLLCGLQGAVGWVMVASGLVDRPYVAPVKLGAHLMLATLLFAWLVHTYLQVVAAPRRSFHVPSGLLMRGLLLAVFLQMFLGALVAGLDAGLVYNTWPLMDGGIAPSPLYHTDPWWMSHLEYIPMVQFQHRVGAIVLTLLSFACCYYCYPNLHPEERERLKHIIWALVLQFGLGVYTLLSVVNITLASLHQLAALLLVLTVVRSIYAFPLKQPVS